MITKNIKHNKSTHFQFGVCLFFCERWNIDFFFFAVRFSTNTNIHKQHSKKKQLIMTDDEGTLLNETTSLCTNNFTNEDDEVIIPVASVLALRKAITSMRDVNFFFTVRSSAQSHIEISIVDHFEFTFFYVHIPCSEHTFVKWVNISGDELYKLASKIKATANAVRLRFSTNSNGVTILLFLDAAQHSILYQQEQVCYRLEPNTARCISSTDDYIFVQWDSAALLSLLNNLCVAHPILSVRLCADGKLTFKNPLVFVEKDLYGPEQFVQNDSSVLCEQDYCIKFIKLVYNNSINCSKKTCLLGFPRDATKNPLVLQVLLSAASKRSKAGIYEYYNLRPFVPLLNHNMSPHSSQHPLEIGPRITTSTTAASTVVH